MTSEFDSNDVTGGATELESVSQRVIEEVAEATGKDPLEMEVLYTRVDPESLEKIFSDKPQMADRKHGQVSFPMAGCQVVVEADGTVEATEHGGTVERAISSEQTIGASNAAESPD
jgi:hypothetical protein